MGRFDPALNVSWESLDLTHRADGKVVVRSIEEMLKAIGRGPGGSVRPVVVWLMDPGDYPKKSRPRWAPTGLAYIAVATNRFRRLRVELPTLPDGAAKARCAAQRGFRWYDPSGRLVARQIVPRRASMTEGYIGCLKRAWSASFTTSMQPFTDAMGPIASALKKNRIRLRLLTRRLKSLEAKADPAEVARLWSADREIRRELRKLERAKAAEIAKVTLRPEFLPPPKKAPRTPKKVPLAPE